MPALLLVTHEHIGTSMLKIATAIIGNETHDALCIEVPMDANIQSIHAKASDYISQHNETLVLTDIYGSTPGNIATQLARLKNCNTICGLNLPMLLRAINYQSFPLTELTEKVINGGKKGIINCD